MNDPLVIDKADKETVMEETTGLTVRPNAALMLTPVMNIEMALARLKEFQEFCAVYLKESFDGGEDGGDYGVIPGTKRKTLLKSGAEKLCEIYGMADEFVIVAKVEQWDTGLFDYTVKCILKSRRDDSLIGTGMGSCSTWESKYRWRTATRVCPHCRAEAIIKGKDEYGGGWVCYGKKGGCGAKFTDDDPKIVQQDLGRVENHDIVDQKNTVLKMAKKRAKIDAVIGATRSSGIFTQDMEDLHPPAPAPERPSTAEIAEAFFTPDPVARTVTQAVGTQMPSSGPPDDGAPHPGDPPVVQGSGQGSAKPAPVAKPTLVPPKPKPTATAAGPAQPTAIPTLPDGVAMVVGLNVKNGTTGTKPWTLYVVKFDRKLKASDGALVPSAASFDDKVATAAENARVAQRPVRVEIIPGKGKGNYDVKTLEAVP